MPERAYLIVNDKKTNLNNDQTTIGRLPTNNIPINDVTISKNHACIIFINNQSKFYIKDLNTVNGTYINGNKLQQNKKYLLRHKDIIQFGKYVHLYGFYMNQVENEKKGKINLKDYCFQFQSQGEDEHNKPINRDNIKQIEKNPLKEGKKVKIPNLQDYLQLSNSLLSQDHSSQINKKNLQPNKFSKYSRQVKISLPHINKEFDQSDLEIMRKQQQNRHNIYLNKQRQRINRQNKSKALEESKIRLQIEKHKYQQEMLRKQYELQQKIHLEQQKIEEEKRRIQQNLLKRQEERRLHEKQLQDKQREKERRFIQQLQQQKQIQLKKIRDQQQLLRTRNQTSMKQQLQRKKKDLQLQARALAQQYQSIYRQTIKKMKNDIEKQQKQIQQLQYNINGLRQQNNQLQNKYQKIEQGLIYARKNVKQISGRNKAFILYASQLQNKLDKLLQERNEKNDRKINSKLKQQIKNSRELLYLKKNQIKTIQEQINKLKLQLNYSNKMNYNNTLQTIIQNHQQIQNYKLIYFEYLKQQKLLKQLWENQLQQNNHLQQQNLSIQKQIKNNKKQLMMNIRDNISKLTQQRLHMLKCLHYLPEQKKKAAKFLIEQMMTIQQQIKTMIIQSQQTHDKIQSLIIDSQRKKQQNQYISQLLFGASQTSHHFDNMKIEINILIKRISLEKDDDRALKRIKFNDQIQKNQVSIYEEEKRLEKNRNRWREGIKGQKIIMVDKNPIVFFGDLLTKRQEDLNQYHLRTQKLKKQTIQFTSQIDTLQKRKQDLNDSLQRYKREQIQKVRQSLI